MDVKALARSKRSHSQHHSKKPHAPHPNQKPKALADGNNVASSATAKKPLGKQVRGKIHGSQGVSAALPSNWERYEEEFDSESEDPSAIGTASQHSDVIEPKSKGADYRHLIAEAQSESDLHLDSFPSLDDVLPGELNQGIGSMLLVRGEGILSWIGDGNFVVEDKMAITHEASFLSLNLHALAEQLANIDLSQRLFIEADLLPPDLSTEGLKASSCQESDQIQTCDSEAATRVSEGLNLIDISDKIKIVDENTEGTSAGPGSGHTDQTLSSQGLISVNCIDDPRQIGKHSQGEAPEYTTKVDVEFLSDPQKKLSTFEAATAEAELDTLLDSFSETQNILSPSGFRSKNSFPVSRKEASVSPFAHSRIGPDSSKTSSVVANLDDALDDLLQETSNLMNQNGLSQSLMTVPVVQSSSSHSGTKSKVLDEFDSWLDTI